MYFNTLIDNIFTCFNTLVDNIFLCFNTLVDNLFLCLDRIDNISFNTLTNQILNSKFKILYLSVTIKQCFIFIYYIVPVLFIVIIIKLYKLYIKNNLTVKQLIYTLLINSILICLYMFCKSTIVLPVSIIYLGLIYTSTRLLYYTYKNWNTLNNKYKWLIVLIGCLFLLVGLFLIKITISLIMTSVVMMCNGNGGGPSGGYGGPGGPAGSGGPGDPNNEPLITSIAYILNRYGEHNSEYNNTSTTASSSRVEGQLNPVNNNSEQGRSGQLPTPNQALISNQPSTPSQHSTPGQSSTSNQSLTERQSTQPRFNRNNYWYGISREQVAQAASQPAIRFNSYVASNHQAVPIVPTPRTDREEPFNYYVPRWGDDGRVQRHSGYVARLPDDHEVQRTSNQPSRSSRSGQSSRPSQP